MPRPSISRVGDATPWRPLGGSAWLLALVLVVPLGFGAAPASAFEHEPHGVGGPRLILPGAHAVQTGQMVALRWSPADSISELEILLSVDGGRHYSRSISPSLDPKRCEFVWRVPDLGTAKVWLRIRFNRGGREIEGAPAAPLAVLAGDRDLHEPLALPPLGGANPGRTSSEREPAPLRGSGPGPAEALDPPAPAHRSDTAHDAASKSLPAFHRPAGAAACHTALAAPRFLPMRT
jgi:hypothetical protein